MYLGDEERFQSILHQLGERYAEARGMRERSQSFVIWISGLSFGLTSVLLIREPNLGTSGYFFLGGIVLAVGVIALWHVSAMSKGFRHNHQILVRLESAIDLFECDAYISGEPILPEEYQRPPNIRSQHFVIMLAWLVVVLALLLGLIVTAIFTTPQLEGTSKAEAAASGEVLPPALGGGTYGRLSFTFHGIS